MKNKYVKLLLTAAVCSSFVLAAEEKVQSINTTIDSFSVDKQKEEAAAKSFIIKGNELFFAGQYLEAAKTYTQAAYIFENLKEKVIKPLETTDIFVYFIPNNFVLYMFHCIIRKVFTE